MELKKLRRVNYFTKALLELRSREFIKYDVSSCANIAAAVEKLILWYKAMPTYKEGGAV